MSCISHQFKHVFIHVPKTAGSSMECQPYVGGSGHQTARQLLSNSPKAYFSWGFVRNPYSRIVSAYHSLKENPSHMTPDVDMMTFDEWIESGVKSDRAVYWRYAHTLPMTDYLCDQQNNVMVDFVGRFEQLSLDWLRVSKEIGFDLHLLPKINVAAKRPHWSTFYHNPKTKEYVQQLYSKDFEIFSYDMSI